MSSTPPLKLAICSWASGIGGGAARMESYYYKFYDRKFIEPTLISMTYRSHANPSYGESIPFIQIDQSSRFSHLLEVLTSGEFDVIQFQGSFEPLVCEVAKFVRAPLLIEVLHNIESGGLFTNIDYSICVSHAVANAQVGLHRYSVIQNGIDLGLFSYQEVKKQSDKIILLQVGRRSKSKINIDMLAPVLLDKYSNLEFWVCGGEHTFESTELVKNLGVVEDVERLYQEVDYFVQLSDNEPFGLVALEAMATGTPVILSNAGGFCEIVENGVSGYLVEGPTFENSITVIEKAINSRQSNFYEILRRNARNRVVEKFDIRKCVLLYQELILELYEKKVLQNVKKLKQSDINEIPPNALIGAVLFDFQAGNFEIVSEKLAMLSRLVSPITEIQCLKIAHEMGVYLKLKDPKLYPVGLFSYLFSSGDCTFECLEMMLEELDEVSQKQLFVAYLNYLSSNVDANFLIVNNLIIKLIDKNMHKEAQGFVLACLKHDLTSVNNKQSLTDLADRIQLFT